MSPLSIGDHLISISNRLGSIEAKLENIGEKVETLNHKVLGNGRPGLLERVDDLEEAAAAKKEWSKKKIAFLMGVIGLLGGCIAPIVEKLL